MLMLHSDLVLPRDFMLPRDMIDSIFEFVEDEESLWIHDYDKGDKITMKINTNSTFINKLEEIVWTKIHINPMRENIIQIMDEEGIIKTLNVYTMTFTFCGDILSPNYDDYYLCEYSFYFKPIIKNDDIIYETNYVLIIKNGNDWETTANIEYEYGYGAVLNGYHYYNKDSILKEEVLHDTYCGFASSYRTFPTVENAQLYEFVEREN